MTGTGTPPRPRRPTLLEDWDVVRAAQHMIETHGPRAAETAELRAESARELQLVRRWRAIAQAIRALVKDRASV